ncbi:hypothetical protein C1752_08945 [Acaryochloris thomasi RCC1774]|uniref:Uncharacterized protein n=1 Tax=Acaryochloris thomasi RCC1774 TaxID=1764569 RepID=A0A2W1J8Z6_9CYAN|nr:hypothetical protein [Acaryochloris thomasi]PZD70803.1 hypothetical protein C1752_08945 [Acaryochloris thomasi RCC1774]
MPTITGTVEVQRSDSSECICCDGQHVFNTSLVLDDYPSFSPGHIKGSLFDWVDSSLDLKLLEGRRIKISAEVLPSEQSHRPSATKNETNESVERV